MTINPLPAGDADRNLTMARRLWLHPIPLCAWMAHGNQRVSLIFAPPENKSKIIHGGVKKSCSVSL